MFKQISLRDAIIYKYTTNTPIYYSVLPECAVNSSLIPPYPVNFIITENSSFYNFFIKDSTNKQESSNEDDMKE